MSVPLYTPPPLPGLDWYEHIDSDDGVVNVPNTGVYTDVKSVPVGNVAFWVNAVIIAVFDAAAVNVLQWQLAVNGIALPPWKDQRIPGGQILFAATIGRLLPPMVTVKIQALIPTSAVGGFDVVARLNGDFYRQRALR